ncbi:hypothetical protein H8E88_02185 [candidate division KSB1 bacterium]|nr:hypothetical protein [candidate division KSB1 bacterium]MBL7094923.1 hypothetical protein [candidate division KSB1 bacterium]
MAKTKNLVVRKEAEVVGNNFIEMDETLNDIFAFKKRIIPKLKGIPQRTKVQAKAEAKAKEKDP